MLGFPGRENSGVGGVQSLFTEGRAENTPNLGKELHTHGRKAKRTPGYLEAKRPFPRHILNLSKVSDKQRVLKAIRKERKKKTKTYKGIPLG